MKVKSLSKAKKKEKETPSLRQAVSPQNDFYQFPFYRVVISKIYKEPKILDSSKLNNTSKKWVTDLYRKFSIAGSQMIEKPLRKCSTSLTTRGMKIKTTLRYYLTSIRWRRSNTQVFAHAGRKVEQGEQLSIGGGVANLYSY